MKTVTVANWFMFTMTVALAITMVVVHLRANQPIDKDPTTAKVPEPAHADQDEAGDTPEPVYDQHRPVVSHRLLEVYDGPAYGVAGMFGRLAQQRAFNLLTLYRYARRGVFPAVNTYESLLPVFIDENGVPGPVAHLMIMAGEGRLAESIRDNNNHFDLNTPVLDEELMLRFREWVSSSGLSYDEVKYIQTEFPSRGDMDAFTHLADEPHIATLLITTRLKAVFRKLVADSEAKLCALVEIRCGCTKVHTATWVRHFEATGRTITNHQCTPLLVRTSFFHYDYVYPEFSASVIVRSEVEEWHILPPGQTAVVTARRVPFFHRLMLVETKPMPKVAGPAPDDTPDGS
jgi:hypothetical protein